MNEFNNLTKEAFGAEFQGSLESYASYDRKMDYVEYLTTNDIVISRRIDDRLTLIYNQARNEVVGFRLKGFEHLFNEKLKPLMHLKDSDFISLVSVMEAVILENGPTVVSDENRREAYSSAYKMADNSNARITDFPMGIAA